MRSSRNLDPISKETASIAHPHRSKIPAGPRENDAHRNDPRYDCDYRAHVVSPDRKISNLGRIVNISAAGAKVVVEFPKTGPSTIFLVDLDNREVYECDVRWRADCSIGVRFVDVLGPGRRRKFFAGGHVPTLKTDNQFAQLDRPPVEKVLKSPPPHRPGLAPNVVERDNLANGKARGGGTTKSESSSAASGPSGRLQGRKPPVGEAPAAAGVRQSARPGRRIVRSKPDR